MKVAIMQPYLFPYIGYFQLIHSVDTFVVLDNVNFIKKGWINRNQILSHSQVEKINLPVAKMSQNRWINQHEFHELNKNFKKLSQQCVNAYKKHPYFEKVSELLLQHQNINTDNVAEFLIQSMQLLMTQLNLTPNFLKASELELSPHLKGEDRILAICKTIGASEYINLPGGKKLYTEDKFNNSKVKLRFISPSLSSYKQHNADNPFTAYMSILDAIANCDDYILSQQLQNYELL